MKESTTFSYEEIDIDLVVPNPLNPRPDYQKLEQDDKLIELADHIIKFGQTSPGVVYYDDDMGRYIILQGERRYLACWLGDIKRYRALVIAKPETEADERIWLGNEDAQRNDWGLFYEMRHAYLLAQAAGVDITDQYIKNNTRLSYPELEAAKSMFKLSDQALDEVEAYEQQIYLRRTRSRVDPDPNTSVSDKGVFNIRKAVLVSETLDAMFTNKNIKTIISDRKLTRQDVESILIAQAKRSGVKHLEAFLSTVRNASGKNSANNVSIIRVLSGRLSVRSANKNAGVSQSSVAQKLKRNLDLVIRQARKISMDPTQIGTDPREYELLVLRTASELSNLANALQKPVTQLPTTGRTRKALSSTASSKTEKKKGVKCDQPGCKHVSPTRGYLQRHKAYSHPLAT